MRDDEDNRESLDVERDGACDSKSACKFAVCFCRRFVICLSNNDRRSPNDRGEVVNRGSLAN